MQHETDLRQNPDARSMRHTPFVTIHTSPASLAARVGKFMLQNRVPLHTPHYISSTSRGAVPHISPDLVRNSTAIKSLYVGLEDFLEKWPQPIPILKTPLSHTGESRLRKFIAARDDDVLILGPRRAKAVVNPLSNGPDSVAILTSTGSWSLKHSLWLEMVGQLQPDIVVGFADLMPGHTPGVKRREKMVDRTHAYTRDATRYLYADADSKGLADNGDSGVANEENNNHRHTPLYFAPILPLENTQQALYLQDLEDSETCSHISGLALYESASLSIVPKNLNHLLRFCLSDPWTPQEILRDIALGADLFTIPMIDDTSNAGIAMVFTFQPSSSSSSLSSPSSSTSPLPTATTTQEQYALKPTAPAPKPLALDLWNKKYSKDLSPITEGCTCYSCRTHHRAYIHHLLSAKEMLGWTLLQIHNHHVMDLFFAAVRQSISNNSFEGDVASFEREYEFAFPTQTGQGPRIRGYTSHLSKASEPPRNPPAYGRLNDALEKYDESLQSSVATPDTNAEGLERHGFAEKISDL